MTEVRYLFYTGVFLCLCRHPVLAHDVLLEAALHETDSQEQDEAAIHVLFLFDSLEHCLHLSARWVLLLAILLYILDSTWVPEDGVNIESFQQAWTE